MADHAKPTLTSLYTDFLAELDARLHDLARSLDPASVSASNLPTDAVRWSSAAKMWQRWTGSAWVALSADYAISITGLAATATRLATARTLSLSGDVTGSASFDGSTNAGITATLAASGVSAASYGSDSAIPVLTVDSKGLITAASTTPVRTRPVNLIVNSEFLAASQATPTLGSELVTNGGFDSDTSGWTAGNSGVLESVADGVSGNCLRVTNGAASNGYASQEITVFPGAVYKLVGNLKSGTGNVRIRIGTSVNGTQVYDSGTIVSPSAFQEVTTYFVATAATIYITLGTAATTLGLTGFFDSVSLKVSQSVFPSSDALAFDGGWDKTACEVARTADPAQLKAGSPYAARVTGSTSTSGLRWSPGSAPSILARYAGRTLTVGCWVKCDTADQARLLIGDGAGAPGSAFHPGDGTYRWLEVSKTITNSPTQLMAILRSGNATAYFSQPMLAIAPFLGEGNYQPGRGLIPLAASIPSARLAGAATSSISATTLDPSVDTLGRIAKGRINAVRVALSFKDSGQNAADAALHLGAASGGVYDLSVNTGGVPVSPSVFDRRASGVVNLNASGLLPLALTATGTSTATATMTYNAIEV